MNILLKFYKFLINSIKTNKQIDKRMINKNDFFKEVRNSLFDGKLSQSQVEGMEEIIDYWFSKYSERPLSQLAYILATSYHETGKKLQPINEWGSNSYFFKMYDIEGNRPHVAKELGNILKGDGIKFRGRGDIQLTGRRNYKYWGEKLNLNLTKNPELVLTNKISKQILIEGMILGSFTTKKLDDYINTEKTDFINARRIVNRLDKAKLIKSYAKKFLNALNEK